MKFRVMAFALTCALLWGFGLFFIVWWIILLDGPSSDPTFLGRIYRGFALTPRGSALGLLWGLADGFIGGAIFAWLYNLLAGWCSGRERTP